MASALDALEVVYLHMTDGDGGQAIPSAFKQTLCGSYRGTLIYSDGYTLDRAQETLCNSWSDLIGFGRAFIANPDLPFRLHRGLPLTPRDPAALYGGDAIGYTDHPCVPASVIERWHEPATMVCVLQHLRPEMGRRTGGRRPRATSPGASESASHFGQSDNPPAKREQPSMRCMRPQRRPLCHDLSRRARGVRRRN